MKTTIAILVSVIILLTAGVGIVAYQKMTFDKNVAALQGDLLNLRAELDTKNAEILELEADLAASQSALVSGIVLTGQNAIYVGGQSAGSSIALVSLAVLAQPGYVVIHKEADGQPGTVIGSSRLLSAGTHEQIQINLSETLSVGANYIAMLHFDSGDGIYTLIDEDLPARDSFGNIIQMSFSAFTAPATQTTPAAPSTLTAPAAPSAPY